MATTATGPTRLRPDVHLLVAPLDVGDVQMLRGRPVTSLARTVADCVRALPPEDALAIADSAARSGLSAEALMAVLGQQAGWPGIIRGRRVAELMDPRRESPLESWSAWFFERWEIRQPIWQVEIRDRSGYFCGRVDAWWDEGLAGEADGRAKYALSAAERSGADAAGLTEVLDRERGREQAIRRTRAELIRWGARDLFAPRPAEALSMYIQGQLRASRAGGAGFTGTTHAPPLMLNGATG